MSDEKRTTTLEGKRPWEKGFASEEYEQKAEARKRKGDNPNAISNGLLSEQTKKKGS